MWVKLMAVDDLLAGSMVRICTAQKNFLVVNVNSKFAVYEDQCAHLGVPLSLGCLQNGVITCSAHHWQYDACSGLGINPTSVQLKSWPVKIENAEVWVEIDNA